MIQEIAQIQENDIPQIDLLVLDHLQVHVDHAETLVLGIFILK